ncbi:HAD-like domain-containing protein [Chytriomyces sp. MP71]|nr:HAD-like domain-containing protein [Chytriomyces sp. MP71]
MSASINKGVALRKLADMLDIRVIQTVCFGDGWNDMDMMHVAGLGFAMANGKEELKQVAHRVTRFSNDEDGVAVELEELLEQGLFASSI